MDEKQYRLAIIEELAKNEEKLSELYNSYGRELPDYENFWTEMCLDEKEHARWIETLKKKIEEGEVKFGKNRFNIDMVRDFFKNIQKLEIEVDKEELSLEKALENSIAVEEVLLERKFFEVFKGDSMDLEIILLALEKSTENHLRKVKGLYDSEIVNKKK